MKKSKTLRTLRLEQAEEARAMFIRLKLAMGHSGDRYTERYIKFFDYVIEKESIDADSTEEISKAPDTLH